MRCPKTGQRQNYRYLKFLVLKRKSGELQLLEKPIWGLPFILKSGENRQNTNNILYWEFDENHQLLDEKYYIMCELSRGEYSNIVIQSYLLYEYPKNRSFKS